jgi:hypothetical protein
VGEQRARCACSARPHGPVCRSDEGGGERWSSGMEAKMTAAKGIALRAWVSSPRQSMHVILPMESSVSAA